MVSQTVFSEFHQFHRESQSKEINAMPINISFTANSNYHAVILG